MSRYPEHDKLSDVTTESQAIGAFLDLGPYVLCETVEGSQRYWPVSRSIPAILAEWFDIDQDKIEAEKRAMLTELRWLNDPRRRRPVARPVEYPKEWAA